MFIQASPSFNIWPEAPSATRHPLMLWGATGGPHLNLGRAGPAHGVDQRVVCAAPRPKVHSDTSPEGRAAVAGMRRRDATGLAYAALGYVRPTIDEDGMRVVSGSNTLWFLKIRLKQGRRNSPGLCRGRQPPRGHSAQNIAAQPRPGAVKRRGRPATTLSGHLPPRQLRSARRIRCEGNHVIKSIASHGMEA